MKELSLAIVFLASVAFSGTTNMLISASRIEIFDNYAPMGTNTQYIGSPYENFQFRSDGVLASGNLLWVDGSQILAGLPAEATNVWIDNPITTLIKNQTHQFYIYHETQGYDYISAIQDWNFGDYTAGTMTSGGLFTAGDVPTNISFSAIQDNDLKYVTNTFGVVYMSAPMPNTNGNPSVSVAWMDEFSPPVSAATVVDNTPAISEWTRQGDSGDTIALSGENL